MNCKRCQGRTNVLMMVCTNCGLDYNDYDGCEDESFEIIAKAVDEVNDLLKGKERADLTEEELFKLTRLSSKVMKFATWELMNMKTK